MNLPARHTESAWLWLAKILTGALIIFVLGVHLVVNHLVAPGGLLSYADVVAYLANPWVVAMEMAFLVLAVCHSLVGLRGIVLDLNPSRAVTRLLDGLFVGGGAVAIVYGIWLLLTISARGVGG